ncbi:MAG: hypothetical protein ACMUIA_01250 [bacterium]
MFQDPIIKEIRKIRHEIEAEYQYDSQKYYEHLQELQKKYSNRLVRRKPKPALKTARR